MKLGLEEELIHQCIEAYRVGNNNGLQLLERRFKGANYFSGRTNRKPGRRNRSRNHRYLKMAAHESGKCVSVVVTQPASSHASDEVLELEDEN